MSANVTQEDSGKEEASSMSSPDVTDDKSSSTMVIDEKILPKVNSGNGEKSMIPPRTERFIFPIMMTEDGAVHKLLVVFPRKEAMPKENDKDGEKGEASSTMPHKVTDEKNLVNASHEVDDEVLPHQLSCASGKCEISLIKLSKEINEEFLPDIHAKYEQPHVLFTKILTKIICEKVLPEINTGRGEEPEIFWTMLAKEINENVLPKVRTPDNAPDFEKFWTALLNVINKMVLPILRGKFGIKLKQYSVKALNKKPGSAQSAEGEDSNNINLFWMTVTKKVNEEVSPTSPTKM